MYLNMNTHIIDMKYMCIYQELPKDQLQFLNVAFSFLSPQVSQLLPFRIPWLLHNFHKNLFNPFFYAADFISSSIFGQMELLH